MIPRRKRDRRPWARGVGQHESFFDGSGEVIIVIQVLLHPAIARGTDGPLMQGRSSWNCSYHESEQI